MTTYQSQSNGIIAMKKQSGLGTPASGSGGTQLRVTGGNGLQFSKAATNSKEVRQDGMMSRGRHGTDKVAGSWDLELTMNGEHEPILEAILRDTWDVGALSLTQSDFTSLAIASNVITFGGGDPRTLGLRQGDVIRLSNMATSANNNKNLRLSALTSSTITTPDTLVDETADTTCTITRPKKLIQYAGASLVRRYWTIDEYDVDIDQSEVASDFVWSGFKFVMQPNGIIAVTYSGVGTGNFTAEASGSSPVLTSPTEGTGKPLAVVDATIRVGGVDVVDLTGFDLTGDIGATAPDVFGSGAQKYSPDVFTGQLGLSLNISALRKDLQAIQDFSAETQYELHVLATANMSEPKDFFSIYVGNFTLGGVAKSALSNQGGARTNNITVPAALVGKDDRGTGYDPTMIKIQSSLL